MNYVATLKDGVVSRVTVQPDDYEAAGDEVIVGPENTVGIGYLYDGQAFTHPAEEGQP